MEEKDHDSPRQKASSETQPVHIAIWKRKVNICRHRCDYIILEALSQSVQNQNAVEDVTCLTLRPSKWSAICFSEIAEVGSPYSAGGSELFIGNSC
jgi:hypothetical protein